MSDMTRRSAMGRVLAATATGVAIPTVAAAGDAANPQVQALESKLLRARPLPLANVRLTGGPLKAAQDADIKYLLELEPDRMLAYYRKTAGLAPKAEPYTGWDGGGRNLTGHIPGHYPSAIAMMYAATGDARFKERTTYIVAELNAVQDKRPDVYLSGLGKVSEWFRDP